MFDIGIDATTRRVVMRISEFPDIATIVRKEIEILGGVAGIMRSSSHFDLLVILEDLGPVAKDVGAHMDKMLARIVAKGLRKSANVGFGAIARMQLQRLTGNDERFRFFSSIGDAEAWLDTV